MSLLCLFLVSREDAFQKNRTGVKRKTYRTGWIARYPELILIVSDGPLPFYVKTSSKITEYGILQFSIYLALISTSVVDRLKFHSKNCAPIDNMLNIHDNIDLLIYYFGC